MGMVNKVPNEDKICVLACSFLDSLYMCSSINLALTHQTLSASSAEGQLSLQILIFQFQQHSTIQICAH